MFSIHELKAICDQNTTTFFEDGQQVLTWRDSLGDKYSDLPGVRSEGTQWKCGDEGA